MRSGTSSSLFSSSSFGGVGLRLALLSTTLIAGGLPIAAYAQSGAPASSAQAAPANFNVPPQALDSALTSVADQGGIRIFFTSAEVAGVRSNGASGAMTVEQALSQVLTGTGFTWRFQQDRTVVIERVPQTQGAITLGPVRVEGAGASALTGSSSLTQSSRTTIPEPFPGGQVARGGSVGIFGNRDYLETPLSITSFTDQLVRDVQSFDLDGVLRFDPSYQPAVASGFGADGYNLRGFYLTGRELGINGLYGLVSGYSSRELSQPFERVEILKGPAANLQGFVSSFGGSGGAINQVTKRASEVPLTRAGVNYQSDSLIAGTLDIGRRFGPAQEWGVRVNLVHRRGDDFTGAENRNSRGSLAVDYRGERLRASLDYIRARDECCGIEISDIFDLGVRPDPDTIPRDRRSDTRTDQEFLIGRFEFDITDRLRANIAHGRSTGITDFRATFLTGRDAATNTDIYSSVYLKYRSAPRVTDINLEYTAELGPTSHRVILAGNLYDNIIDQAFVFAPDTRTVGRGIVADIPAITYPDADSTTERFSSLALADVIGLFDERLQLTLSLRRQNVVRRPDVGQGYDETVTTPAIGVLFKPVPQLSLYGSYVEGFRPGATAPVDGFPPISNPGEVFPPFVSTQQELGVKWDGGRVGASAALFQINEQSEIIEPATGGALPRFTIDGEQRNRGLELSVFGEPLPNLRVIGGLAIIEAKRIRTQDGLNDGKDATGVPRRTFTANLEYDVARMPGLTVTSAVRSVSGQFWEVSFDPAFTGRIPGYTTFDVGARYSVPIRDNTLTFRLNVRNLTDKKYYSSSRPGLGLLILGESRMALLNAEITF